MFVKTLKVKKTAAIAAAAAVCAALVLLIVLCVVRAAGGGKSYAVKTEQQRQTLIAELGWKTSEKPSEHKTAEIPAEFDEVYSAYNELQKQQGFDLTKYKGKKVEIYSYPVYNYKGHKDCMTLTIIGCEGRLIGGDVSCSELDGFMQGLMSTNKK